MGAGTSSPARAAPGRCVSPSSPPAPRPAAA